MSPDRDGGWAEGHGGWAYVSIVSVLPGVAVDVRLALALQFLLFEGAALGFVVRYDRWEAFPAATAAILVTTVGSGLMIAVSDRVRGLSPPAPYRRLLFDSSIDVLLGVVTFLLLVTFLLVDGGGSKSVFLDRLLGESPPAPAVFFSLVVLWDLCYRIGTGWWASLTGLWRSLRFRTRLDDEARRGYRRADLLTIVFASLQLALVPFLWPDRLLALALLGHVAAVFLVSTTAIALLGRSR